MALVTCEDCGKEISDHSAFCVHCGRPAQKYQDTDYGRVPVAGISSPHLPMTWYQGYLILLLLVAILAVLLFTGYRLTVSFPAAP